jgi:hypothetical protein
LLAEKLSEAGRPGQRGVLALEVDPGRLSVALVNHYLDIKQRSQL